MRKLATFLTDKGGVSKGIRKLGNALLGGGLGVLLVFALASQAAAALPTTAVDIDIKPGSDPNSINLCSMGVIPVAIFGSATFDVNDINRTSLALADASVKMAGRSGKDLCHVTDVNDDGFDDLVCQFVSVGLALSGGDTTATVVGELNDGTPFEGADSVNIVKDVCG